MQQQTPIKIRRGKPFFLIRLAIVDERADYAKSYLQLKRLRTVKSFKNSDARDLKKLKCYETIKTNSQMYIHSRWGEKFVVCLYTNYAA